jgi:hypothetical protein
MDPFAIIILGVVAGVAVFMACKIRITKKNGIEAEAVVSNVTEETTMDSDGSNTSYTYYVRYTGADGEEREAKITNVGFKKGPEIGDRIRIKYLPEKPNAAVWIR